MKRRAIGDGWVFVIAGLVFDAAFVYLLLHPRPGMGPLLFVSGGVGLMWTLFPLLYALGFDAP